MVEIQALQKLLAEKDAEIERRKTLEGVANASNALACQQLALAKDQIKRLEEALQRQDNVIIDKDAEIERLRNLSTRAADALAGMDPKWEGDWSTLIAELRKAAE